MTHYHVGQDGHGVLIRESEGHAVVHLRNLFAHWVSQFDSGIMDPAYLGAVRDVEGAMRRFREGAESVDLDGTVFWLRECDEPSCVEGTTG